MIVFTSHAADPGDLFEFYVGDIKHILIVKRASMIIILLLFNLLIEPLLFDFFPFWQASVFKLSKLNLNHGKGEGQSADQTDSRNADGQVPQLTNFQVGATCDL